MKKIVVFGAGLVAGPLVRYLMDVDDYHVTVATRTISRAEKMIGQHKSGTAVTVDVENKEEIGRLIDDSDIAISLVPFKYHPIIARACLDRDKNMVTTSYVSPEMRALDSEAKDKGLILLNEVGVDPGIDHMSAMRVINDVQKRGGKITSFMSYCGGLPAPESNDNPFGYKFSWSPRGVILAGLNNAHYLKDKAEINVDGKDVFSHTWLLDVEGAGTFDAYPNRDSYPYIELYGLKGVETMYRGTLRYIGWCETWKKMVELGIIEEKEADLSGKTFCDWIAGYIGMEGTDHTDLDVATHLGLELNSKIIDNIRWLGFFDDKPIGLETGSGVDILEKVLLEKLVYKEGERDMLIMHHQFKAEYADSKSLITSTLIDYGIPNGDSSMSRTVSLPCAISTQLVLEGKIAVKGVHIPVIPEIYEPVLDKLSGLGIVFKEKEVEQ